MKDESKGPDQNRPTAYPKPTEIDSALQFQEEYTEPTNNTITDASSLPTEPTGDAAPLTTGKERLGDDDTGRI